jgi:hypothetical protein
MGETVTDLANSITTASIIALVSPTHLDFIRQPLFYGLSYLKRLCSR